MKKELELFPIKKEKKLEFNEIIRTEVVENPVFYNKVPRPVPTPRRRDLRRFRRSRRLDTMFEIIYILLTIVIVVGISYMVATCPR